jgi:GntR family transcriptional regulator
LLLHRESPSPLYKQVKESLTEAITAGQYSPHYRLPSERDLSERFNVSRMTVRQALLEMAREGIIYTRTGRGTFVSDSKISQPLHTLTGFTKDVIAQGGKPSSRVLELKVMPATPEVTAALRLTPMADVILLSRLRLADDIPLAIETGYLPFQPFPKLMRHDFAIDSLYTVLQNEYQCTLIKAEQTIEVALAGTREIELLRLKYPAAIFKIHRLSFSKEGTPVEYMLSYYRGDRYKFQSTLLQPVMIIS